MRTASATATWILETWNVKGEKSPVEQFFYPTTEKPRVKKNQWDAHGSVGADYLQLDLSVFLSLSLHLHPHHLSSINFYVSTSHLELDKIHILSLFCDSVILFILIYGLVCTFIQAEAFLTNQTITISSSDLPAFGGNIFSVLNMGPLNR